MSWEWRDHTRVVYGPWPYPAYPPYYWYPPGYVAGAGLFSFSAGFVVGAALWGNCNWRGGDINIDINRYSQFTKIDRTNIRNTWQHNAEHRRGTPYRDRGSQQRFGQRDLADAQTREAFRGRAEQGRERLGERGSQGQRFEGRPGQGLGQTREAGAFSGMGNGAQARTGSVLKVEMMAQLRSLTDFKTEACGLPRTVYLHI